MTSSAIEQAAASTRTAPSRHFMVQQAVLNTLHVWCPAKIAMAGLRGAGIDMLEMAKCNQPAAGQFAWEVRTEFRKIAAQYSVTP